MSAEQDFFAGVETREVHNGKTFIKHALFTAAVNHARAACGRDHAGNLVDPGHAGNWAGNICYLALLDQLATCFGVVRDPNSQKYISFLTANGIRSDDANAIYALRCALVHEFGLVNISRSNPDLQRAFTVTPEATGDMVQHPKTPWDGAYASLTADNVTIVHLGCFANQVERIIADLKHKADSGGLATVLDPVEFETRFFMFVGPIEG